MQIPPVVRPVILAVALVCTAVAARAQVPASSFDELRLKTRIGQNVTVTGPDGEAVTGNLMDLSPEHLTVLVKQQPVGFERWQVRLVEEQYDDPLGNGALNGALWMAVPALVLTLDFCPFCLRIAAGYAVFGALIGTAVDAGVRSTRPIYLPPAGGRKGGLSLAPLGGHGRAGVALSVGF